MNSDERKNEDRGGAGVHASKGLTGWFFKSKIRNRISRKSMIEADDFMECLMNLQSNP